MQCWKIALNFSVIWSFGQLAIPSVDMRPPFPVQISLSSWSNQRFFFKERQQSDEEYEEYEELEDMDDEEIEEPQQLHHQKPPRKMTQIIRGQKREYHFLRTVNSVDELEKIRFKVMQKNYIHQNNECSFH
jgi:hypothetical protein